MCFLFKNAFWKKIKMRFDRHQWYLLYHKSAVSQTTPRLNNYLFLKIYRSAETQLIQAELYRQALLLTQIHMSAPSVSHSPWTSRNKKHKMTNGIIQAPISLRPKNDTNAGHMSLARASEGLRKYPMPTRKPWQECRCREGSMIHSITPVSNYRHPEYSKTRTMNHRSKE